MKKPEDIRITSASNPRIKAVASLHKKNERSLTGLIVVEGSREAERALKSGAMPHEVYYCPDLAGTGSGTDLPRALRSSGIPIYSVSRKAYEKIAYRKGTEGIVLVMERPRPFIPDPEPGSTPFYLAVDGIEKPGNLGAIFRTADGSGASGVLVTGGGTEIYNPNVIRASIGTVFTVPFIETSAGEAADWLGGRGIPIIAATPSAAIPYYRADLSGRCALVVGREDTGISAEWLDRADVRVSIPMRGAADSLNVSVSASILAYEALRQRSAAKERPV